MKKKMIIILLLVLSVFTILCGVFLYLKNIDNVKGCYFQKMYGSIGIVSSENYSIRIDMFCFDNEMDFLDDVSKLSFDNSNVSIVKVSYEEQKREENLVVYGVNFSIAIAENGRYDVTALNYFDDGKNVSYHYQVI